MNLEQAKRKITSQIIHPYNAEAKANGTTEIGLTINVKTSINGNKPEIDTDLIENYIRNNTIYKRKLNDIIEEYNNS